MGFGRVSFKCCRLGDECIPVAIKKVNRGFSEMEIELPSEQDGVPSLVMERVDMNLTEFLGTNPDLSSRLEVLADVCEALKHLLDSCIAISIQITWASIGTKLRVEQFKRSCSTWASSKATPPLC